MVEIKYALQKYFLYFLAKVALIIACIALFQLSSLFFLADKMFTCSKGYDAKVYHMKVVGRYLPNLRRSYLSFDHMCGRILPTNVTVAECQLWVEYESHRGRTYTGPTTSDNATKIIHRVKF